ncbi:MAG: oligopeptidase B, partial [Candidatus Angelobacter sp.]
MSTLIKADNKASSADAGPPVPPVAAKIRTDNRVNGGHLVDDYHWLREKSNPQVAKYLDSENTYTAAVMKPTEELQKTLYAEMISHIKETDANVPYKEGAYYYYSRWEKGEQYPIFVRKKASLEAEEAITIDQNELAKGQPFMALGGYEVSK